MTRPRALPRARLFLPVLAMLTLAPVAPASAQPVAGAGIVDAALLLRRLDGAKRVLMIGAHPDDENSALLATLARGMGVETAYLSLTRGDGGQNLLGPELSEELGLMRSGELVAARTIDGGRQYFTRAVDYGFSKSAEEAFSHWPRETLLRDVVWVIRRFQPQVVVSVFSGTPADGHGQHQAAGIVAREAFTAAGDAARFPDQLAEAPAWQADKLFRSARGDVGVPLTTVETGVLDPVLGRSWYQLAMEGRSQHRSQDMGAAQPPGPRGTALVLVDAEVRVEPGAGLFAGVDTALAALAGALAEPTRGAALERVRAYRAAIHRAEAGLGVVDPGRAAAPLAEAVRELDALAELARASGGAALGRAVAHHRPLAEAALMAASGIVVEAATGDGLLVPGGETTVTVTAWNGGSAPVEGARPEIRVPMGWSARPEPADLERGRRGSDVEPGRSPAEVAASGRIAPGELAAWAFRVEVPADAAPTEPYYLRAEPDGDLYRWPDDPGLRGLPFDPPVLRAGATFDLRLDPAASPVRLTAVGEAPFVGVDQGLGEYREPVLVVPALSVAIDQSAMVWPLSDRAPREIAVRLQGRTERGVEGTVRLEAPEGWDVEPAEAHFAVAGGGSVTSAVFRVRPPEQGAEGRVVLRAVARGSEGRRWDRSVHIIDYPHIRRVVHLLPAEVGVTRAGVRVAEGLRVGYVMGTGDGGFEALRQLGVEARLLAPAQVAAGDFSDFDAIVVGVRAYETRPDLAAANARLLEYARDGGTVIVQYQQYQYANGGFAPYSVSIARPHDRVIDETAPVRVLDLDSPLFNTPNRIGAGDWEGWRQERGLYFLGEWDERFIPQLAMADPGEDPLSGSLLVARVGEGVYVYTGLAFFRQFPVGVPGAYRLFANLVSLDPGDWARHLEATAR